MLVCKYISAAICNILI